MSVEKVNPPEKHRKRKLKRMSKMSKVLNTKKSKSFLEEASQNPERTSQLRKLNLMKARIKKKEE
jgi:hypothetical protein